VINLEVFGESAAMEEVAELLDDVDGVSRVRLLDATRSEVRSPFLGTNVAMLVVGASATLAVQRTLVRRAIARGPRSPVLRR